MEVTMCTGPVGETKKQLAHVPINDASQTKQIYSVLWQKRKKRVPIWPMLLIICTSRNKIYTPFVRDAFVPLTNVAASAAAVFFIRKILFWFGFFFSSSDSVHYQMAVVVIRIGCHFCSISRKQMPPQQQQQQQKLHRKTPWVRAECL